CFQLDFEGCHRSSREYVSGRQRSEGGDGQLCTFVIRRQVGVAIGGRELSMPCFALRSASSRRRPAFTLLEILIATAVSVLLMGALYMAINVQLRHAQIGREVVEESLLARALLTRIDTDIRLSLGPPAPA